MAKTTSKIVRLYCQETPGLKLGPGISNVVRTFAGPNDTQPLEAGDVIVFSEGFATFEEDQFPEWKRWVSAPGTPYIRVLDDDEGASDDGASFPCPLACGKGPFKSEFALNGHLRSHAPKEASTDNAAAG